MGVLKKLPPTMPRKEVRGLDAPNLLPINGDPIHRVTVDALVSPAESRFQGGKHPGGEDNGNVLAETIGSNVLPDFNLFHFFSSYDPRSPGPGEASVRV